MSDWGGAETGRRVNGGGQGGGKLGGCKGMSPLAITLQGDSTSAAIELGVVLLLSSKARPLLLMLMVVCMLPGLLPVQGPIAASEGAVTGAPCAARPRAGVGRGRDRADR